MNLTQIAIFIMIIWNQFRLNYAVLNEEEEENFKLYLKALFAQQIFDINAYFKIVNTQDIMLKRVVQLNEEGYPLEP